MTLGGSGTCPNCGAPRDASSTSCGTCGRAYDAPLPPPPALAVNVVSGIPPAVTAPAGRPALPLIVIVAGLVLVGIALVILTGART